MLRAAHDTRAMRRVRAVEESAKGDAAVGDVSARDGEGEGRLRDTGGAAATSERTKTYAVTTARSTFVEEEFALWKRYQAAIHGDDPSELTRSSYERFLVHSPFDDELAGPTTPSTGYGAFHQQYRIDGVLVAVGVVDILPKCLSSKYFFYEPAYAHLSLGKVSAPSEINFVLRERRERRCPDFEYYYMGYYIHDCVKMRYKAEYAPSEILCATTGRWTRVDDPDVRAAARRRRRRRRVLRRRRGALPRVVVRSINRSSA